jgi:hypothetical protein
MDVVLKCRVDLDGLACGPGQPGGERVSLPGALAQMLVDRGDAEAAPDVGPEPAPAGRKGKGKSGEQAGAADAGGQAAGGDGKEGEPDVSDGSGVGDDGGHGGDGNGEQGGQSGGAG